MQSSVIAERYAQLLRNLCKRYPSLINLEELLPNTKLNLGYIRNCRVRMIDVGLPVHQVSQFDDDPDLLLAHLKQTEAAGAVHQRIYVLENLTLAHIALFGTFFDIDPCIFASQIRTANWEEKPTKNNTPKLLSSRNPARSFSLRYNELRLFQDPLSNRLMDIHAGRRITSTRLRRVFANVGLVKKCATFWCREMLNSWDGMLHRVTIVYRVVLILIDPPVTHCLPDALYRESSGGAPVFVNEPYQGGYQDFTLWSEVGIENQSLGASMVPPPGPPRTSTLDDIVYYLSASMPLPEHPSMTPQVAATILKKFVLSHWVAHIEYTKSLLNSIEAAMAKQHGSDLAWLETQLTDLFRWSRRLSSYCEQTETALDNLGLLSQSYYGAVPSTSLSGSNCDDDFHYVHRRMQNMKNRAIDLISTVNGLIGTLEVKQTIKLTESSQKVATRSEELANRSLGEARTVRALTILGIIFVPLSTVASIFSIQGNYGPGQPQFWVYWVIAIPVVCFVLSGITSLGSLANIR